MGVSHFALTEWLYCRNWLKGSGKQIGGGTLVMDMEVCEAEDWLVLTGLSSGMILGMCLISLVETSAEK